MSGMIRERSAAGGLESRTPFHACWYPIALSAELAPGELKSVDFLGGRVVVYRTERGEAFVKSAYCRHLGADLSVGAVVGDKLRCAFHHWDYGTNGKCAFIPAGDPPPGAARLFSYPTQESLGIIWAFNGEEPTYGVPAFSAEPVATDSFRNPRPMAVSSDIVLLNSFDIQHFKVVHKLEIALDEQAALREPSRYLYAADVVAEELGAVRQDRILWGVSCITIESLRDGRPLYLLHALCPNAKDRTTGFLVNALGPNPSGREDPEADAAALSAMRTYSLRLVEEDAPIFDTIRFERGCLTRSDRFLGVGFDYITSFAEHNPGEDLIN